MIFYDRPFRVGDRVVFSMTKWSMHPGRRARDVRPEVYGDGYHYHVEKFWTVRDVGSGDLVVVTRRGKLRTVRPNDPRLRLASLWERLLHGRRFPSQETPSQMSITSH